MRARSFTALAACLALHLAACGGGDSAPPPPVPTLSDRAPASGAVEATDGSVMLRFSVPMDAASLASGISVSRDGGAAIEGAVSSVGDLAYFNPSVPFPAAATLRVTVSADVRSTAGGRMGTPASWTFTTAHWRPVSSAGAPTARSGHSAAWTGTEMIVWGGTPSTLAGGRYDPATDSWLPTTTSGAPASRIGHTAVWTGTEMIVWGGTVGSAAVNTGGAYNPTTGTWRALSTTNAPSARSGHTAVWTGTQMIVWGAADDFSGGRYDPGTDTWTPTSLTGAPVIKLASRAAWTGTRMAVWGGVVPPGAGIGGAGVVSACPGVVNVGGLYDPVGDTWTPTSTSGAPDARRAHAFVWTGADAIVWGGCIGTTPVGTGARFDPAADSWIPTAEAGAPTTRSDAHAAWTGSRLLVWSGIREDLFLTGSVTDNGALFDPATDSWTPMSTAGSAAAQQRGSASVWTGSELIVWGGETAGASGARFTP